MNDTSKKKHKGLKIIGSTVLVLLIIFVVLTIISTRSSRFAFDTDPGPQKTPEEIAAEISVNSEKAVAEALNKAEEKTRQFKLESISEGFNMLAVADSNGLTEALGYGRENVSFDVIRKTINDNPGIPQSFKEIYLKLANDLEYQYPNMELRIWYENLKTLKVYEVSDMDMKLKAISIDAYGVYRRDENAIYTVKGYEYIPGTWEYQVIVHEMCHPIRSAMFTKGGIDIRCNFEDYEGDWMILDEAMNSLLSLRSYDSDERNIAYQLQSNMTELILDSMDNYTLEDYVGHNITYFENVLNIQNGDDKAIEMLTLLDLQYNDYHDDKIHITQDVFYPLYDYIARMYYNKRINLGSSYDEALKVMNEFIDRITYDVPKEYELDTEHMREYFEKYCSETGIK